MFNSLTATKILLPEKLNYQVNFINYKNNSLGKVINKTFWQKKPQRELFTTQALS